MFAPSVRVEALSQPVRHFTAKQACPSESQRQRREV